MNTQQINSLLDSFYISKEELSARTAFKEFANSLSDIIIDDFATNYLLNNPNLNVYLSHTNGSMLLKKIKDFFTFILISPVDEEYIKKIHFIGSIHYSIKLEPAKVSYGFWALNEIINKMATVNEIVKEYKTLLSKLLRFVEHIMNDGYYIQKNKKNNMNEIEGNNAQNELYIGFNLHKLNMQKIAYAIENQNIELLNNIVEDSSECNFGKVICELSKNKKYEYLLGFNTQEIEKIHQDWHKEYVEVKKAIIVKNDKDSKTHFKVLEELTTRLKNILDKTLENSLADGQLSLSSGIRSMRRMTDLFYEKNYGQKSDTDIQNNIEKTIQDSILSELHWAVEDLVVSVDELSGDDFEIIKQIRYKTENIFIGINLKLKENSSYLLEMINLLLEVLDLHLSVKEREQSLIDFADKAESANKSKDMFLANMSHELRTPLNAITGFSQILMMKKDTPESVKKYVQKINIAGNNLLDLVNTILDFAKLEAGKMQFNPSLSNISEIIKEVHTLIYPLATKKNISLKMPNIISLNLFIDKTLFKQVLINLLTNAIKFTPQEGEVNLNIVYSSEKRKYVFEVKDNGIGLSPEAISKLFQAFSQVENAYQKEHKGTGLGLMISKKIIEELHQGNIWVESEEGNGSSFFISMATPMVESHTYTIEEAPHNAKKLLVVEDSENYQKILIEHLKSTYNMTITDTINKAKDILSKEDFDYIILDFFLTDGISSEVLQFMEEEGIKTPTMVISAEDEINISSSLAGSSNLEYIGNKKNIVEICDSLKNLSSI